MKTKERREIILQVINELIVVPLVLFGLMNWVKLDIDLFEVYIVIVGFQLLSAIFSSITYRANKESNDGKGPNI